MHIAAWFAKQAVAWKLSEIYRPCKQLPPQIQTLLHSESMEWKIMGDNRAAHWITCYNLGNEVKSLFFW